MALTTPILYNISAFDATKEQTFTFNSLGGSQVVANTLTIRDNATLTIVYSQTQTTYRFEHILPANTLNNGSYYQAVLVTKDAQGNESSASSPIQFYCFTKPTFVISNMPSNHIIENSSFSFAATYSQIQGETLNAYVFNLYSSSGVLISTSGAQYNTESQLPIVVSYLFSGFEDKTVYKIEVTGVTTNGTQITTGQIEFTTNYISPDVYSTLFVKNNCKEGYITIQSNVVGIDGKTNPSPAIYIDNTEIDLRQSGSYVLWDEGYVINGDWTMRLWGREFTPNTLIVEMINPESDNIFIYYCEDSINCWFEVKVVHSSNVWGYVVESTHISIPDDKEQLFCWLRRIGNVYELKIENRGVES